MVVVVQMMLSAVGEARSTTGLETACQKSSDVKYCMALLKPYASQFEDNHPKKMGFAAISSAVAHVQAMRAYMVRQTTEPETTEQERSAVKECLGTAASSDNSLRMASQEFDQMKDEHKHDEQRKQNVAKMIDSAKADQSACSDSLKKHTDLVGGGVIGEAVRLADRSVQACSLAHIFVQ